MGNVADYKVRLKVLSEWQWTKTQLTRLNGVTQIRPADDRVVIREGVRSSPDVIPIAVGPVIFNIPERGNHRKAPLFVYLEGGYEFSRRAWIEGSGLETTHVFTKAAYFRLEPVGEIILVHGVHYDCCNGLRGHPAFHLQLQGALQEYGNAVRNTYALSGELRDGLEGQLRNVRMPSAQLDPFSCILQIAADHLLPPAANTDERNAFNALHQRAELCGPHCRNQDSPQAIPSPAPSRAYHCYRARHWYAQV